MKKIISIGLAIITIVFMLVGCDYNKSFIQAREKTINFYLKNQNDFETAKTAVLTTKSTDDVSIKNISYISFHTWETSMVIDFDYDSQGMLGGQYWGIVFISDDIPRFERNILSETETDGIYYWEQPDGNNFYILERISENWFFFYLDYDGHLKVSDFDTN